MKNDVKLIIVQIPPSVQVHKSYHKHFSSIGFAKLSDLVGLKPIDRECQKYADNKELLYINCLCALSDEHADKHYYKIDGHLTFDGHEQVADCIYELMHENSLFLHN